MRTVEEMPNQDMRFLSCFALVLGLTAMTARPADVDNWPARYDRLLNKYVSSGGVRYMTWKSDPQDVQELRRVVEAIGQANVAALDRNEQLAFYLNAYNAWILHEALTKYPTKSIKDPLFLFFISKRIKVTGEQMSFDELEKQIRSKFKEPRVHFVLNCASRSCPPLNPDMFRADTLLAEMEKLARNFVNSPKGVSYNEQTKTAEISKIFDWYKGDFGEAGPIGFINQRRSTPLPNDVKIQYQAYDWSLNEAR